MQELVGDVPGGTQPLGARVWGDVAAFVEAHDPEARPQRPWFVMGGRDDPRQKGYDVAAQAARALLAGGADACFLWFPIPGDEGLNGLQFLADLAWEYPQQVLVFPFVFRAGYMAALQGATIALMPSFYEPFGAANEFYLQGTIGLGRATGGLVQQIIPLQKVEGLPNWSSYSPAVARRSQGWHLEDAPPTGLLYREADDLPSTVLDWQGINEAAYNQATPEGGQKQLDRVTERRQFAVWEAMVEECHKAMKEALQLYREHPLVFDQLLLNGIAYIQARFSWEQAARLYLQLAAPRLRLHPNKKP